MVTSIGIIIILGLLSKAVFEKIKLPGLLGMLILGIVIGPFGFDLLSGDLMAVSDEFRFFALIIILLRAGIGISRDKLNKVGKQALKLGFIPCILEGTAATFLSVWLLGFTIIEGGILGFMLAAVSPAVVVPSMLYYREKRIGTKKGIPTLIMAGSSLDDVFAIIIFSAFLGLYNGSLVNIGMKLIGIPLSILIGIGIGAAAGFILVMIFKRYHIRDTGKVLFILGVSIMITALEQVLKNRIEIAGLLGVMTIGFVILERRPKVAKRLAGKLNKIWIFAEILLFVLVGAQVDVMVALDAGLAGLAIILIGVTIRSAGVFISTAKSHLNMKERLFCAISYTPKATVQAAIGAVPLSLGIASGDVMLAVAVLAILVTAPLGAIAIKVSAPRLLEIEENSSV